MLSFSSKSRRLWRFFIFFFDYLGVSKFMVSSIFYPRHLEHSEGSADRDFSPTAQNDEFVRQAHFVFIFGGMKCIKLY